jgi:hypothetical protein
MADAPKARVGEAGSGTARPARVLTPDEELRLLQAHAELSGDLAAAARLQTAYDPLEETQENPELPVLLRSKSALPGAARQGGIARLRRIRQVAALALLAAGVGLLAVALFAGPG